MGVKLKTCRVCKTKFTPWRTTQVACSPSCALAVAESTRTRRERKDIAERKAKLKTKAEWLKDAQASVNAYVRARDAHLGCVSCDKPASWGGQWHASHFRSVGSASSVRFNLWNIHKSCSVCNNWLSSNHVQYAPRLREKIGDEKVDWLMMQNKPVTYSIEYLSRIKQVFRKKKRLLDKRNKHE